MTWIQPESSPEVDWVLGEVEKQTGPLDPYRSVLVSEGFVGEVLEGHADVSYLVGKVGEWRQSNRPRRRRPMVDPADPAPPMDGAGVEAWSEQRWARSILAANAARRDRGVMAWRAAALDGKPLPSIKAAADWVERTAATEGASEYATVVVPDDVELGGDPFSWRVERSWEGTVVTGVERRTLDYPGTGRHEGWVTAVVVRHWGKLDRLRELSERLAKRWAWQPAQASGFVLTDRPPLVLGVRTTTHRSRITVEAESEAPASLVAEAVRSRRRGGRGLRPLTPRNARVVAFVAERPGWRWVDLARAWDSEHPDEAFGDRRTFVSTTKRGLRRLGWGNYDPTKGA